MNYSKYIAIYCILIGGVFINSCQTPEQKVNSAEDKVQDAKLDSAMLQKSDSTQANSSANAEEWRSFKAESELKIKHNEIRIAELKLKIAKAEKPPETTYEERIDTLEQRNKDLHTRMVNYEGNRSNWETFKAKFNQDMNGVGQSLQDFTIKSKH
jgi:hypothetical protein